MHSFCNESPSVGNGRAGRRQPQRCVKVGVVRLHDHAAKDDVTGFGGLTAGKPRAGLDKTEIRQKSSLSKDSSAFDQILALMDNVSITREKAANRVPPLSDSTHCKDGRVFISQVFRKVAGQPQVLPLALWRKEAEGLLRRKEPCSESCGGALR